MAYRKWAEDKAKEDWLATPIEDRVTFKSQPKGYGKTSHLHDVENPESYTLDELSQVFTLNKAAQELTKQLESAKRLWLKTFDDEQTVRALYEQNGMTSHQFDDSMEAIEQSREALHMSMVQLHSTMNKMLPRKNSPT